MTLAGFAAPLPPLHLALRPAFRTPSPHRPSMPPSLSSPPRAQQGQPSPAPRAPRAPPGPVRVRQHVNPLARRWSRPLALPPGWYPRAFREPSLPLVVDLGVAKGRFLASLAAARPARNFLGLEIREPLVHQANRAAESKALHNVFYIACNANVSLAAVLADVPKGVLRDVYVQFCDPWFKKRHAKRRMVNPALVEDVFRALARAAEEGGEEARRVFIQSDVVEIATEMRDLFDRHGGFRRLGEKDGLPCVHDGWLSENPLGVPTEREIAVHNKGGNVYRALYVLKEDVLHRIS